MYRETKSAKKKNNDWETVASTIEELKVLANSFNGTSYKAEKALRERIRAEIIEPMEEKILQNKLVRTRTSSSWGILFFGTNTYGAKKKKSVEVRQLTYQFFL